MNMEKITQSMIDEKIGKIREDEYIDEKGLPICKKCNTPRYFLSDDGKVLIRCSCHCQHEAALEQERKERVARMVVDLKSKAIQNVRYNNATFENTEVVNNKTFKDCYNRLKSYCEHASDVVNTNLGLYVYGGVGCGKTHLTYCMINALTERLYSCYIANFINIMDIIKESKTNKKKYDEYMRTLQNVDFLFIDDLGVENDSLDWVQERMFDLIDYRYNNNKPIIFTSNYSIGQLVQMGLHERTASRVHEISSVVFEITADSYRLKNRKKQELPF